MSAPAVAVVIPARNEAVAIADVVTGFRAALPAARVYVYDNVSEDATARIALRAGADVRSEPRPGKGNVLRRAFADVEADVYVLVDGDATYHAASAPGMVRRLTEERLDMVVAHRRPTGDGAWRAGHQLGNRLLTATVRRLFGGQEDDVTSGYRALSRRFVKSFPAWSGGFEIEAEMTVHALELRLPVATVETPYSPRPRGAASKLDTWRDGFRILFAVLRLFVLNRPFRCFGIAAAAFFAATAALCAPALAGFLRTGQVPDRPALAIAAAGCLATLAIAAAGLVLHAIAAGRVEARRLAYLAAATGHE